MHGGVTVLLIYASRNANLAGIASDVMKDFFCFIDAPTCRHEKGMVIGASRSESLEIVCEIDADPPAQSFRWKFNNSGETLDVGPERFSSNGSVSVLKYTPVADLDYGTLSCWAQNAIGMQVMPCVYQLVAAGEWV